jgi:hypothetical protein
MVVPLLGLDPQLLTPPVAGTAAQEAPASPWEYEAPEEASDSDPDAETHPRDHALMRLADRR